MPKHRQERVSAERCAFCQSHKDEVPYMMTSPHETVGICTHCVFGMAVENMRWAGGVFAAVKADHERRQKTPPSIIRPDSSTDAAIKRAQNGTTHRKP